MRGARAPVSTPPQDGGRARALYEERLGALHRRVDRVFEWLMVLQWIGGVLAASLLSPQAWDGSTSRVHPNLLLALFLGGALSAVPLYMLRVHRGRTVTRHVVAVAQALWSALLIHLSGGRLETHFHIFGSLAFLAFYRDPWVVLTGTVVVTTDHIVRGAFLPASIYGVLAPSAWRWLEHAAWVAFEDVVLVYACLRGKRDLLDMSAAQAGVERFAETFEHQVVDRTRQLQVAHDKLVSAGRFLAAVYQALPGALFVFDQQDRIKAINDGTRELLGYEEAELIGAEVRSLFVGTDAPSFGEIELGAGRDPTQRVEKVCRARDGTLIPVLFSARLLRGIRDSGRDVVCVALDLRDRKKLEVQMRQNQKLESLGQLAAGIAHEINTPTQFVGDNTRFLQASFEELLPLLELCARVPDLPHDAEQRALVLARIGKLVADVDIAFAREEIPRAIEDSLGGLARISGIVRAMKEFSHPCGKNKEPADINRCIESTVTVARNEWKYVATVETDLAPDLPAVVCFPQEVNQVLLNMIVNAAHAIADARKKRGTEELGHIRIVTRRVGDEVELRVSDDGCGIPEAIRGRIFDPFFTTKEVGRGTGQGLAIAHNVVIEKHGGSIEVESRVDEGTTFVVRLPLGATSASGAAA